MDPYSQHFSLNVQKTRQLFLVFEEKGAPITFDSDKNRDYVLVNYRGQEWEGRSEIGVIT